MTPTSVSLFSGVGGLDLGLHRAGIEPALFCEMDTYKRAVLAAHWSEVPIHDDVRTLVPDGLHHARLDEPGSGRIGGRNRPRHTVDLLHGGFPCQDVSVAGKRAGLAGARTGLFWDAMRVVDAVRPSAVLLENVPGLLSSNNGADFATILDALDERGYGCAWRILDAQHFGVPQRRRRVFLLALAGDDPRAAAERAGQVLAIGESLPWHPAQGSEAGTRTTDRAPSRTGTGVAYAPSLATTLSGGGHPNSNMPGRHKEDDTNLVACFAENQRGELTESDLSSITKGGGKPGQGYPAIRDGASVRRLMPIECERLMGWPDNWTAPPGIKAPDSRRYAACGDGVVAPVAEWIGRRLGTYHFGSVIPNENT